MMIFLLPIKKGIKAISYQLLANYNIPLWDAGKVPGAAGDGPLDAPFLTVFEPPPGKANGTAVIIAPGGSNLMLMYGLEGNEVAERMNDWGVTAFVLTYRLNPRYGEPARVADGTRRPVPRSICERAQGSDDSRGRGCGACR